MTLQAAFAEIDITPPPGIAKIGWLKPLTCDEFLSPLYARIALLQNAAERIAVVQLDTLFVAWPEVAAIRQGVVERYGFPGAHVLAAATHNHAGPALTHAGDVPQDAAYAAQVVERVLDAFGAALARWEDAELGMGSGFNWRVAHNRRVVMRDGTVRTHGAFCDPDALYLEGPVDPEVAVIGLRRPGGDLLGALVNFSCHPTHHGGDCSVDAGYPGVLAAQLHATGCPVTLFLNGACGNVHTSDPCAGGAPGLSAEEAGLALAQDAQAILQTMTFRDELPASARPPRYWICPTATSLKTRLPGGCAARSALWTPPSMSAPSRRWSRPSAPAGAGIAPSSSSSASATGRSSPCRANSLSSARPGHQRAGAPRACPHRQLRQWPRRLYPRRVRLCARRRRDHLWPHLDARPARGRADCGGRHPVTPGRIRRDEHQAHLHRRWQAVLPAGRAGAQLQRLQRRRIGDGLSRRQADRRQHAGDPGLLGSGRAGGGRFRLCQRRRAAGARPPGRPQARAALVRHMEERRHGLRARLGQDEPGAFAA